MNFTVSRKTSMVLGCVAAWVLQSMSAAAQDPDRSFYKDASGPARVTRSNGYVLEGELVDVAPDRVRLRPFRGGRPLELRASRVKSVATRNDTFTYNPDTRRLESEKALEAARAREKEEAERARLRERLHALEERAKRHASSGIAIQDVTYTQDPLMQPVIEQALVAAERDGEPWLIEAEIHGLTADKVTLEHLDSNQMKRRFEVAVDDISSILVSEGIFRRERAGRGLTYRGERDWAWSHKLLGRWPDGTEKAIQEEIAKKERKGAQDLLVSAARAHWYANVEKVSVNDLIGRESNPLVRDIGGALVNAMALDRRNKRIHSAIKKLAPELGVEEEAMVRAAMVHYFESDELRHADAAEVRQWLNAQLKQNSAGEPRGILPHADAIAECVAGAHDRISRALTNGMFE